MQMQQNPHILIVDDDNRILKLLKKFLIQNGLFVSTTTSQAEAIELLDNFTFDLIILDVMMPGITGLEFAQKIKNSGKIMPIVMLTALSEPEDRIKGLEAGASDYVTKPFEPRELLLRINNLINSHNLYKKEQEIIRFDNSSYNLSTKEFKQNNENIKLSSSEQKLLDILVDSKNIPVSRDELAQKMDVTNIRSIDVQIARLRSKLELNPKNPKFLKTIRNQGYVLYS
jgi:two-component system phosphate regulon response regulator OmpR